MIRIEAVYSTSRNFLRVQLLRDTFSKNQTDPRSDPLKFCPNRHILLVWTPIEPLKKYLAIRQAVSEYRPFEFFKIWARNENLSKNRYFKLVFPEVEYPPNGLFYWNRIFGGQITQKNEKNDAPPFWALFRAFRNCDFLWISADFEVHFLLAILDLIKSDFIFW